MKKQKRVSPRTKEIVSWRELFEQAAKNGSDVPLADVAAKKMASY